MTSIIKFNRTIRQSGRSSVVALPPEIMNSLEWKIGDQVKISVTLEKAVIIEKLDQFT